MPLAAVLAAACGHDDLVVPDVYEEPQPTPYVELRIAIPAVNPYSTRSHPTGGEDGNGRERGVLKEDLIHDVNIFFYKDAEGSDANTKGLNGNDNTPILHQVYINVDNLNDPANTPLVPESKPEFEKNYLNLKLDIAERIAQFGGVGTNFAAVANFGEIQKGTITTLGQLRNLAVSRYSEAWKANDPFSKDASTMDYFLMSTAYNQDYTYGDEHTGNNKIEAQGRNYVGTTTLERMYARIDLWYNAQENAGIAQDAAAGKLTNDRLVYSVNNAVGNKVYIYNILPVNVMRQPSFLFKKVSSTEPNSWEVSILQNLTKFNWGGKESVNNGRPNNYVLEPNTTKKTADGKGGNLTDWYGNSRTAQVKTDIMNPDNGKVSSYYSKQQTAGAGDPTDYNCNRISIISYANENTQGTDCFHSNYLTGLAFRAIYVPEKIYNTADDKDSNEVKDDETLTQIYRYSPTSAVLEEAKSLYFSNITAAQDYAKAHPGDMAIITQYTATKHIEGSTAKWGFICYYNLWLRHYNDVNDTNPSDPHEHLPMEYATVRNNIYRVKVDFNGPGDPSPTMRAPDTMKARIYVRKGKYRPESDIIFD